MAITDILHDEQCPYCGSVDISRLEALETETANLWLLRCNNCEGEFVI